MGKVRCRKETGSLYFDFFYKKHRCREHTALPDTPTNVKRLEKTLIQIEQEIKAGTFVYARYFPNSKTVAKLAGTIAAAVNGTFPVATTPQSAGFTYPVITAPVKPCPLFKDFAAIWSGENEISWRRSHRRTILDILNGHLLPVFGEMGVGQITKSDILTFRSTLAKVPGRKAETLSAKRINAIMAPLRQILNEAADRYDFTTPYRAIKPLKMTRPDVEPFTFDEVQQIISTVREDFRNYYTVRFLTGMRTGEIDGLKWKYVDFTRRQILIRETIVGGEEDTTKTDSSQREIQMSQTVFDALQAQQLRSGQRSQFVFCNYQGNPMDHNNVTKRIWYPLLKKLGMNPRRPYQSRHTAATLWLASGENPLWIARQLGHSSTEMLFKVYGRFVPNLTRQDGSAFERLLLQHGATTTVTPPGQTPSAANDASTLSAKEI